MARYRGHPFILLDLESGDCKRFQNVRELRSEFKMDTSYGISLEAALELPEISKRYKFFAYEYDLLRNI